MAKKKLLIADKLPRRTTNILEASGVKVDERAGIEADELAEIIKDYDALIVRSRTKVTAKLISAGKKLKVIGRAGVGVDNIDLEATKKALAQFRQAPRQKSLHRLRPGRGSIRERLRISKCRPG